MSHEMGEAGSAGENAVVSLGKKNEQTQAERDEKKFKSGCRGGNQKKMRARSLPSRE